MLLDNGRTAALADPAGRQALHCIRCSACLNVCPVYERVGGHAYGSVYPGPIGAILSPMLTGVEDNASLPYASSLCGACYDACPVKIDIPSVLVHLRARHVEESGADVPGVPGGRARAAGRPGRAAAQPGGADHGRGLVGDGQPGPVRCGAAGRAAGTAGQPGRQDPAAAAAAVRLDRGPGRARAAGPDVPRMVALRTRGVVPPGCTVSARDEVLGRIRTALADVGPGAGDAALRTGTGLRGDLDPGALLDLLTERLADYRALVRRAEPGQVLDVIAAALAERGARRLVVPPGLDLPGAVRRCRTGAPTTACPPLSWTPSTA